MLHSAQMPGFKPAAAQRIGKQIGGGMSHIADTFIGGWRLSGIFTVQSGNYNMPYFPDGEGDPSGTGSGLDESLEGWDPSHRVQYAARRGLRGAQVGVPVEVDQRGAGIVPR